MISFVNFKPVMNFEELDAGPLPDFLENRVCKNCSPEYTKLVDAHTRHFWLRVATVFGILGFVVAQALKFYFLPIYFDLMAAYSE
mmetsp:Transcript_6045/g.10261  ORF Transcript_6045/g.10261 Transcript_6045/m.10261 type:complete len:85 (+) Transcript_6045:736-990(+)